MITLYDCAQNENITNTINTENNVCQESISSDNSSQDRYLDRNSRIGFLNVCGLKSRMKYEEFTQLIEQYPIFCVAETKLDQFDIINLENYKFFSKPRTEKYRRKSGGLGFFVHSSLIDDCVILDSNCEYVYWLKMKMCINGNDENLVIGCMYIPPE